MPPCSDDRRRETWQELSGSARARSGPALAAGAGGMGLHTILLDPSNPERIYIAISAAGAFRTEDARQDLDSRSTEGSIPTTSPIRTPKSAIASIASPCIPPARTCCSCKNTGT